MNICIAYTVSYRNIYSQSYFLQRVQKKTQEQITKTEKGKNYERQTNIIRSHRNIIRTI